MKAVIDTNSLLSLIRYYLPFDKKKILFEFFKSKISDGEIIIIDKVLEECNYISKRIVMNTLSYLTEKAFLKSHRIPFKTDDLIVPDTRQFLHQLGSVFVNSVMRRKITEVEFENQKELFLKSADLKQIIVCLNFIQNKEDVVLVTEETESDNDNKLFKKIPAICRELKIETITLPGLIARYREIDIEFQG